MINEELKAKLAETFKGEVTDAMKELAKAARDTSLFTITPSLVVFPTDADDVAELVKVVRSAREAGAGAADSEKEKLTVTGRAAGTDMSGGPLTKGIVADFTKHMNKVLEVAADSEQSTGGDAAGAAPAADGTSGYAITEPGVYYRDFEKETLKKDLLLPSYPASRDIAAMGGIVANDSGGERTLEYGKTEKYVEELDVVLSDGSLATFKALAPSEVEEKKLQPGLEGEIYRKMDALLSENAAEIAARRPKVSKNSAGYALWDIKDATTGTFNLAKLITGSQGTLALWTKAKLRLVKPKERRAMLVIFLSDLAILPEIVRRVLVLHPESFESYDEKTFTFATKFLLDILKQMGLAKAIHLGIEFLPEVEAVLMGGVPKLILMAEFAEETIEEADRKARAAEEALRDLHLHTKVERNETESEKYWIVRRQSFALLRKSVHGYYAAPFIDDFVVPPDCYPEFIPKLNAILDEYKERFIYTIAGHIGDGNFHIIPLMDLKNPESKRVILELSPRIYDLVISYGGTTTGEHNDGIVRTPYLPQLFGEKMVALFAETKKIFDPSGVFNPHKKVGGTFADIDSNMLKES